MTSRARVLAAIRREAVDYVPCVCTFNPLTPPQRRGYKWQFPWPPEATTEQQLAYQVEQLGLDQVVGTGVSLVRPSPEVKSRVWLEGQILHKVYTTPAGELHAAVRYDDIWPHGQDIPLFSDFNIGHFVKPWLQTEQDLSCLKHIIRLCDTKEVIESVRANCDSARRLAERYNLATIAHVGTGLTGMQQLCGAEQLCFLVIDNPALVDAYLEHEHHINLRTIEIVGQIGVVDIIRRNGFYETADFYSPSMLEHFLGARLRREAEAARAYGMLTSYTIHTGVMPILDYLATLKMDSFFGIDIAFKGVDLLAVRDKLSATTSFWIGPSSTFHLWNGPEPTRLAVRQVFEVFGRRGLILSPCVSAHSIMPWESTLAMLDEWRKLR